MRVENYLFFDGRCEEALDFYSRAIGAEVTAKMRFADGPAPQDASMCGPGFEEKIMHSTFRIGETIVMASDGRAEGKPSFQGFSLAIRAPSEAEGEKLFNALADGGQVHQPLIATFFAKRFAMVADRFGVSWMIVAGATH